MGPAILLILHLVATIAMVGIIWFVQIVHYPLFDGVGSNQFDAYESRHVQSTGYVVGPPMLVEAATAIWLAVYPPAGVPAVVIWLGLGVLALIWASTAALQVPAHERLSRGFDTITHRRLVHSNWFRTVGWSVRGVLAVLLVVWGLG
jgi:hypothetical protein